MIFWARAQRMVFMPAEGGCFCLEIARPSCMLMTAVRSPSLSRKRTRRYLSTLPSDCHCLSSRQRVRYRLFSRRRPRVHSVFVSFCVTAYRIYTVSPALAWRFYQVAIVSHCQSCEYNCHRHLASDGLPAHRN